MIWGLLALTWAPETPGNRSSPLQLHIPAQNTTKFWATISAHCAGDDVIMEQPKKAKPTLFLTTATENPEPKSQKFFFQCKLQDFTNLSRVRIAR